MSKYSEKTKRYIRYFAQENEPKTIDDLIAYLAISDREAKIGARKIRHTIGDLVYRGILKTIRCKDNRRKCLYRLTKKGGQVASEFHGGLPEPVRLMDAEKDTEQSVIIPKENDLVAPPTPVANHKTKTVDLKISSKQPDLTAEEAFLKFKNMYDQDPYEALMALARSHVLLREKVKQLEGN